MYSKQQKSSGKIIFVLIFLGVLVAIPYLYWNYLNSAVDVGGQEQDFIVESGESVESIANRLKNDGLIRSPFAFKIYLKNTGRDGKIQAGDFKLSPALNVAEIADKMAKGSLDMRVTLIEGWRDEEMAGKLLTALGLPQTAFLKVAKEGYMFPDTYVFSKDVTVDEVVERLRENFDQKYDAPLQSKVRANGLTPEQGVILASLVEREARSDDVRQKVASILLKRFKIGMALNVDATVQYARDSLQLTAYSLQPKSQVKFIFWQPVNTEDYKTVDSPFNTYLHVGLPPSPICNPSLSSLKAVADADSSTPYLYYYHDSKGNSYYARTLEEHNANVAAHH